MTGLVLDIFGYCWMVGFIAPNNPGKPCMVVCTFRHTLEPIIAHLNNYDSINSVLVGRNNVTLESIGNCFQPEFHLKKYRQTIDVLITSMSNNNYAFSFNPQMLQA